MSSTYIALIAKDATGVTVIDIRKPSQAAMIMNGHETACANSVQWVGAHGLVTGTHDG